MSSIIRFKTSYPGVFYISSTSVGSAKPEKIYYIRYRKNGKLIEEKAGRQFQNDMTPARAAGIRSERIEGKQISNEERREAAKAAELAEAGKWTIDRLWKEYENQKPKSSALVTDANRYHNYIKPVFGDKEPSEIMQLDIDRLRITLLKKRKKPGNATKLKPQPVEPLKPQPPPEPLKPQTVKHVLALLKRIINFGINKQLCNGINFKITMPSVNNLKTEDLTEAQLKKLMKVLNAEPNLQIANLMKMVLFTGTRRGELFKLLWTDIDFEKGFIHIRDPKGGVDQKIPLNKLTKDLLTAHPRTKIPLEFPDKDGLQETESPFVFPGKDGKQRTDANRDSNRIKDKAGLPKNFRALHGLRHVYASMLASSGKVDMYTLQKLLTHKHPLMTQRYAHLRDETLKNAAGVAEDILTGLSAKKEEDVELK